MRSSRSRAAFFSAAVRPHVAGDAFHQAGEFLVGRLEIGSMRFG
jgi:hypothetical protein